MTEKRRPCKKCGRNRAERFFTSPRGHTCKSCRKKRVQLAGRDVRLMENYGITEAEYQLLFERQDGRCAICRGKRSGNLDVDHDHALERAGVEKRKTIRGLLCRRCNRRLLPAATDNTAVLENAISYLRFPPAQGVLK